MDLSIAGGALAGHHDYCHVGDRFHHAPHHAIACRLLDQLGRGRADELCEAEESRRGVPEAAPERAPAFAGEGVDQGPQRPLGIRPHLVGDPLLGRPQGRRDFLICRVHHHADHQRGPTTRLKRGSDSSPLLEAHPEPGMLRARFAMAPDIPIGIGQRLRFYREGQRRSQVAVAGLAGIAVRYLREIEQGRKTPSVPLLYRLADILTVPVSAVLGEPALEPDSPTHPAMTAMKQALMGLSPAATRPPTLVELRRRVDDAERTWLTSPARYSDTGLLLPQLVQDADRLSRTFTAAGEVEQRREAHRLAAETYFLTRTWFGSAARLDIEQALLAGDCAVRAAEYADDPLWIAVAKWERGHALLSAGHTEASEAVVLEAAGDIRELARTSDDGRYAAAYGALHLVAAISAGRRGDPWTGRSWIRHDAEPAARRSGESHLFLTSFGPANVGLHSISLETAAGQARDALRLGDAFDPSPLRSVGRRCTYHVELARCYDQQREDLAALYHLQMARREAPEELRYSLFARDLVRSLTKRARPLHRTEIRRFAQQMGVEM
jgi:transcriptional regulator with XRE-family HTH domain